MKDESIRKIFGILAAALALLAGGILFRQPPIDNGLSILFQDYSLTGGAPSSPPSPSPAPPLGSSPPPSTSPKELPPPPAFLCDSMQMAGHGCSDGGYQPVVEVRLDVAEVWGPQVHLPGGTPLPPGRPLGEAATQALAEALPVPAGGSGQPVSAEEQRQVEEWLRSIFPPKDRSLYASGGARVGVGLRGLARIACGCRQTCFAPRYGVDPAWLNLHAEDGLILGPPEGPFPKADLGQRGPSSSSPPSPPLLAAWNRRIPPPLPGLVSLWRVQKVELDGDEGEEWWVTLCQSRSGRPHRLDTAWLDGGTSPRALDPRAWEGGALQGKTCEEAISGTAVLKGITDLNGDGRGEVVFQSRGSGWVQREVRSYNGEDMKETGIRAGEGC